MKTQRRKEIFEWLTAALLTSLHVKEGWLDLDVPGPYEAETSCFAPLVNFAY